MMTEAFNEDAMLARVRRFFGGQKSLADLLESYCEMRDFVEAQKASFERSLTFERTYMRAVERLVMRRLRESKKPLTDGFETEFDMPKERRYDTSALTDVLLRYMPKDEVKKTLASCSTEYLKSWYKLTIERKA